MGNVKKPSQKRKSYAPSSRGVVVRAGRASLTKNQKLTRVNWDSLLKGTYSVPGAKQEGSKMYTRRWSQYCICLANQITTHKNYKLPNQ